MKKRQRLILQALADLGGKATTREIAHAVCLDVNGVSQSLGALADPPSDRKPLVRGLGGAGGEHRWKLIGTVPPQLL